MSITLEFECFFMMYAILVPLVGLMFLLTFTLSLCLRRNSVAAKSNTSTDERHTGSQDDPTQYIIVNPEYKESFGPINKCELNSRNTCGIERQGTTNQITEHEHIQLTSLQEKGRVTRSVKVNKTTSTTGKPENFVTLLIPSPTSKHKKPTLISNNTKAIYYSVENINECGAGIYLEEESK